MKYKIIIFIFLMSNNFNIQSQSTEYFFKRKRIITGQIVFQEVFSQTDGKSQGTKAFLKNGSINFYILFAENFNPDDLEKYAPNDSITAEVSLLIPEELELVYLGKPLVNYLVLYDIIHLKYYEFANFPSLEYTQPNIKEWLKKLKPIQKPALYSNKPYTIVGFNDKEMIYVQTIGYKTTENSTFFMAHQEEYLIKDNMIEQKINEISLPSELNIQYLYKKGLIREKTTLMGDVPAYKEKYTYRKNSKQPKYKDRKFLNPFFAESEKNYRVIYDKLGQEVKRKKL